MGGASVGGMMGGTGMGSRETIDSYMQQALASTQTVASSPTPQNSTKEVVRIKCRNCGTLEAEDATFCRKCGKPL
jgi:membrane protease subunit (stomatin/prohibitin family)